MADGFQVNRVIASGSVQELVCQFITFPAPAEEVKEIRKTVIIDNCHVAFDKVIIDGRLRKDIMFKQSAAGFPQPGTVQSCQGITATITGPILDVDVDIAFNALIPVIGARPGDQCHVLQAFVEGEKEEAADILPTGGFNTLVDKSIVFICVKVVRDTITTTLAGGAAGGVAGVGGVVPGVTGIPGQQQVPICPPRRSTGAFLGGDGTIPAPRPGLVPGTWVGPTLVFGGVLNPGIPSTIPLANVTVANPGSIVQIAQTGFTSPTTGTGTGTTTGL